jgi:hypothetical protein
MTPNRAASVTAAALLTLAVGAACSPKTPSSQPYLQRMTTSGERMVTIDTCVDPTTMRRFREGLRARVSNAPLATPRPALVGCTHTSQHRPDGSIHSETICDRAAGARSSYRRTSDGTPQDMRMHTETYGFDPNTGAPKTTVRDMRTVRLGPCPADLKPGQARSSDGMRFNMPTPESMLARLPAPSASSR